MFFQESLRFIQLLHHIFGCGLGKSIYKVKEGPTYIRCFWDVYRMFLRCPYLHWIIDVHSSLIRIDQDKKLLWQKMRSSHRKDLLQQSQNHQNRCILGRWLGVSCFLMVCQTSVKLLPPKKQYRPQSHSRYQSLKFLRFTIFVQSRVHVGVVDRDDLASVEMTWHVDGLYARSRQRLFAPHMRSILAMHVTRSSLAPIGKIGLLLLLQQWYLLTGSTQCLSPSKQLLCVQIKTRKSSMDIDMIL